MDLKERLVDGDVYSYSWLSTLNLIADMMTKEMKLPVNLENVIMENFLNIQQRLMNEVRAVQTEIWMNNIRNR